MQSGFNGMINVDEQAISESKSSSMRMANKSDKRKIDSQTSDEIYKVVHDFHMMHGNKIVGGYVGHQDDEFNNREYDTEEDPDYGKNQWRMGDGQTALNNYIYFSIAGFSEFDTFRSAQIREGVLSREEAEELVAQDNIPKYEAIYELGRVVGFNADNVLSAINSVPKLY